MNFNQLIYKSGAHYKLLRKEHKKMGLKLNNISHLLKFKRQFHSSLFLRTQSQNVITTNFSPARSILYVPGILRTTLFKLPFNCLKIFVILKRK
jgi:hypothetical protein